MWKRRLSRIKLNINFRKILKYITVMILTAVVIIAGGLLFVKVTMEAAYQDRIYTDINSIPQERVGIVFGAGLENQGLDPSPILEERVMAAVELYKAGKISKIIMTGDKGVIGHNEPKIMIETAVKNGVKEFDLQPDYAGRRTYDSCYRAKAIFGVNKAILITQGYHLPRAMYLCSSLGIEVYGYSADKNTGLYVVDYYREYLASFLAFWDISVVAPTDVVLGDKITI